MNKNILKNLAKLEGNKKVDEALASFADKIFIEIKKPENKAEIYSKLELLEQFSYRVPDKTLEIIEFVLKNKCQEEFSDKILTNYGTITFKCFELLKSIRYLKTEEIFDLLVSLNLRVEKIEKTRNETLKSLLQYNFKVLKQVGLAVQRTIINKIIGWKKDEKIKNIEIIKIAIKEFLQPSYEYSNMIEWNKLQFTRGSLIGDKDGNLAKIRKESIDLIFELYNLVADEKEKFELIKVLDEASRGSHSGTDESLENIIRENSEYLIKKYQKIVFDKKGNVICGLPAAMEIEKQLLWFKKRCPKGDGKDVNDFITKLKKDDKYFVYRSLVDVDRFERLEDKKREIGKTNFSAKVIVNKDWINILNDIAKASKIEEAWKFNDFHGFLTRLTEKEFEKGEYFLKDALKKNSALSEFSDAFILGFRNTGRVDLWDKYVSEIEKKKNGDLLSKILHSFYFYFKNTKKPDFREEDFSWIKNIASRKGKYNFLLNDGYKKYFFDHTLFRAIILLWKYKKKSSEALLMNEIKKANGNSLEQKIDDIELFISWNELEVSKWNKENLEYLVNYLIESREMDYRDQKLIEEIGKIDFDYVLKVIKKRLDLLDRPIRKSNEYYDAIPRHLEEEFITLIKENKNKFEKEIIFWVEKKKPESFSLSECGSLLRLIGGIYSDVIKKLVKKDTLDTFDKVLGMTKSIDKPDLNLVFEIADSIVISKKLTIEEKKKFLDRIGGSLYSTGMVSGEHGISEAHKQKAEDIIMIKKGLEKNKKSKMLIEFADRKIKDFQDQSKKERIDEDRQIKIMEIDFES